MKAWSNVKHEKALEKRRQKKLSKVLNINSSVVSRTEILDANKSTEVSTQTIDKYQVNINEVM